MLAITVAPGAADSAKLEEVAEPPASDGAILVRALALGVCGTDREIASGAYGEPPPGRSRLILGHESLGEVLEAPPACGLVPGDLLVGIVRRPDPVPCPACAVGEWDMCRNGRFSERGIKGRDGYGAERFRIEPEFALKVDPALGRLGVLLEPASILAKAWQQIEWVGRRGRGWRPERLLVTGAGPIGLLAALMGVQRGLDVHVLDHHRDGPKPRLTASIGATYHSDPRRIADIEPDVLIECTGATEIIAATLGAGTAAGVVCLAGVGSPGQLRELDIGAFNRALVLDNRVVFGTVNANRQHYELAVEALTRADSRWLQALITRRVPLARWREALEHRADDVKVVVDFALLAPADF